MVDGPDLLDHVHGYARMLATTVSPASLAASKRQVYEAFHLTAAESVRAAEALLDPMMAGPDYREGVAALREKRPPVFGDPPPAALTRHCAPVGAGFRGGPYAHYRGSHVRRHRHPPPSPSRRPVGVSPSARPSTPRRPGPASTRPRRHSSTSGAC